MGDPIAWGPIVAGLILIAAFVMHAARAPRPLIDVKLFKVPAFGAASATTFLLAGSLFGAMIILPLYYQVDRGESALAAGLLMAPQGLGAAMVMPIAGKLADKVGGGRVAVVGLVIATLGTLPFAFVGGDTPYWLLGGVLVVRGIGIGSTMMPAMAAAYATLESAAVPRATSALNVLQRVGGALGTCIMAVVLQHEIRDALGGAAAGGGIGISVPPGAQARVADTLAGAFATTFWWAVGACLLALIPAIILARTEQRAPRAHPVPAEAVERQAA
jgi:nitrate/nitrite transporter NarK